MGKVCIQHIVAGLDFSVCSARVLTAAHNFALRFSSQLTLMHVVEVEPEWIPPELELAPLLRRCRQAGRLHLSRFITAALSPQLRPRQVVSLGKPVDQISALAERACADLIMIGSHGHGESPRERFIELLESDVDLMSRPERPQLRHILLGSTAERIVRHSPCSVLVTREPAKRRSATPEQPGPRTILVATDLSRHSIKAFPMAEALARAFDARLLLRYVLPVSLTMKGLLGQPQMRERATVALADLRRAYLGSDLAIEQSVIEGVPHQALCETARRSECDLIVLATQGYTGLRRALIGSCAERVVRHAPCPVLVVR